MREDRVMRGGRHLVPMVAGRRLRRLCVSRAILLVPSGLAWAILKQKGTVVGCFGASLDVVVGAFSLRGNIMAALLKMTQDDFFLVWPSPVPAMLKISRFPWSMRPPRVARARSRARAVGHRGVFRLICSPYS